MKKVQQTKWSVFFILILLAIFSCSKDNEPEEQYNGFNFDAGMEFSVYNSQNEDLLNPENQSHLDSANIKLFYVINGEKKEVYNPNLDSPRNFMIYKHENDYRIRVFLNHSETSYKPITYIQWNDSDTDTIEVSYQRTQNATLQNKIWLNGEQIWERGDNTIDPYFVLTK